MVWKQKNLEVAILTDVQMSLARLEVALGEIKVSLALMRNDIGMKLRRPYQYRNPRKVAAGIKAAQTRRSRKEGQNGMVAKPISGTE